MISFTFGATKPKKAQGPVLRGGAVAILFLCGLFSLYAVFRPPVCATKPWNLATEEEQQALWAKEEQKPPPRPDVLVVGAFFSGKQDPQRGRNFKNCKDYLKPWYDSIHATGMRGVLLHDGLSQDFIKELTTDSFSFVLVNTTRMHQALWPAEWRMFALYDYLRLNSDLNYVFSTDVSDVTFNFHVGDFIRNQSDASLFLAYEGGPDMGWMQGTWQRCFKEPYPPAQKKVYAAGLFGGKRDALVTHLYVVKTFLEELAAKNPGAAGVCDMVAHNKAVYQYWKMDKKSESIVWEEGQPLYNKIKTDKGEPGEEDDILSTYSIVHRHRHINCP